MSTILSHIHHKERKNNSIREKMQKLLSKLLTKNKQIVLVGILTLIPTIVLAKSIPTIKHDDKVRIKEGFHLLQSTGDKVWRGWSKITIPINFVDEEYEYLIGHPKPPEDYSLVEKDAFLDKTIYGRKRETRQSIAASYPLYDTPSVIIGTTKSLKKSSNVWVLTLLHEMFHVLQQKRNSFEKVRRLKLGSETDASWQLNYPFPYSDDIVRGLAHQLGHALYRCLKAKSKDALKFEMNGYLEIRKAFREILKLKFGSDDNSNYCKFQEWTEGGASYTEGKIIELAGITNYDSIPEFQKLPDFEHFREIWERSASRRVEQFKNIAAKNFTRIDFYSLGAGQAEVLDKLGIEWKDDYFKLDIWLDDLFATLYKKSVSLIGKLAPDFMLKDFSGREYHLKDYLGKPVLLFFLSAGEWAVPAHRMLPSIESIVQEFRKKDLIILGIAVQSKEAEIKEFLEQKRPNFPLLLGMSDSPYVLSEEIKPYRIHVVPSIVIIQKDGTVAYSHTGFIDKDVLRDQLLKLFAP